MFKLLAVIFAVSILFLSSCTSTKFISTTNDLQKVLDATPVGESRYVELVGTIRPYSGSFPKGRTLTEIAVGEQKLLIHWTANLGEDELAHMNQMVSARVKLSHFPLPDSHTSSQISGVWVTEITDIKAVK